MATAKKRKTGSRRGGSSKKGNHRGLQLLLQLIVILLVLSGIALAAAYVYQRQSGIKTNDLSSESNENSSQPTENLLTGTWINNDTGAMFTIEGNHFNLDFPSVEAGKPMIGKIQFSGNSFILNATPMNDCENITGKYTFKLHEDDLKIILVNDNCTKRAHKLRKLINVKTTKEPTDITNINDNTNPELTPCRLTNQCQNLFLFLKHC